MDNASTDDTSSVFDEVVGADGRFSYLKRPTNVPALENFHSCLEALSTKYFLWRADDDLSADNYIEDLAAALDRDPDADLAVSPFIREKAGEEPVRVDLPDFPTGDLLERAKCILRNAEPTWIYGMWRREALLANVGRLRGRYNYMWASDHALMLPTFVAGRVTASKSTWFYQRILGGASYGLSPVEQIRAREQYAAYAEAILAENHMSNMDPGFRSALKTHLDRNVGSVWRLRRRDLKRRIKSLFGGQKNDA